MLNPKSNLSILLYVNIISWALLLGISIFEFFGTEDFSFNFYLKGLLLNSFILFIFFFLRARIDKKDSKDFVDLLIQLFVTGLVCSTISLVLQFIFTLIDNPPIDDYEGNFINIIYHVNIALVVIFLTQAFFFWRIMVFHQKSKHVHSTWNIYEYLLLFSLIFNFFEFGINDWSFDIMLIGLIAIGAILSINLKWVAYLNAREKWQAILLLLFIGIFAVYFFQTVIRHSFKLSADDYKKYISTDLMHSVYILGIFAFVIFYTVFSLLVILFNLPTTGVFEKKIEEILSFQKLANSLQSGHQETQVYDTLLDTTMNSVKASAAWLDVIDEEGFLTSSIKRNIDDITKNDINKILKRKRLGDILSHTFEQEEKDYDIHEALNTYGFGSVYTISLVVRDKRIGKLVLLKENKEGFDAEKEELIKAYVQQTSIAIENFRLVEKTIEVERYKEEMKIATTIQKRLLPEIIDLNDNYEIVAFSESAYEVGGDYYDIFHLSEQKSIIMIGDVSGKGATAAFNMAQMKGIFQSLAHTCTSTLHFLECANDALANCLEKSSFITASLLFIDTETQSIEISRAGHCPTIYYKKTKGKIELIQGKGLALGMLRDASYINFIESKTIKYSSGDTIVLYTDGILEARNKFKEEYGQSRLGKLISKNINLSLPEIKKVLLNDLSNFCKDTQVHDDYTAVLMRFI